MTLAGSGDAYTPMFHPPAADNHSVWILVDIKREKMMMENDFSLLLFIFQKIAHQFTWNRVAVAIISRICPINNAKMNTPISQATVINSSSPSLSGFGFLPIDVAVFVANAKHRTYGCPLPLNTQRSLPKPANRFF